MQNKGAIQLFAILLSLVCIYHLSFTFVTRSVEKDAKEYAAGDPEKERDYLDSIGNQEVYNILINQYTYKECKAHEINLGLDLKGGMNVTLEVSLYDLLKVLSNNSSDPTFNKALDLAKERQSKSTKDFVTLFYEAFKETDPNAQLASPAVFGFSLKEKIGEKTANDEVIEVVRKEAQDAINSSFDVLRSRIDKFGVTQPNIQRLEGSDRILVELPGIKEPERARKLLQSTAKLEFWETYECGELVNAFENANKFLKDYEASKSVDADSLSSDSAKTEQVLATEPKAAEADPLSALMGSDTTKKDTSLTALAGDSAKLRAQAIKENPLYAVFQLNLRQDAQGQYMPAEGPVVGYCAVRDTAKLNSYLKLPQVRGFFPPSAKFLYTVKTIDEGETTLQLVAIKVTSRDNKAPLEGDAITDARQDFGQFGGKPEIAMAMNAQGASAWKKLTAANIGRSIAIVLDNYVYSFPTVQGEIPNGRSSITGNFTINEAKDLATILEAGKLPAPAKIVEEAIVGPSLGQESISSGMASFGLAILLVLVFMIIYYHNAGIVANIALLANIFFIMGVLSAFEAVLTLPGIAGIVLIVGISVDSNVLIFERIKEELAKGSGIRLALQEGYNHAYSAIIDSNVTSLLTGIILFFFGTGPIQGFATTLIIGIFCSLFAAIFISRLVFEFMLNRGWTINYATKFSKGAFKNSNFDFIGKRKMFYVISGTIIVAGIISMASRGFNYGVDFLGGRSYVVEFADNVNTDDVTKDLTAIFEGKVPAVKSFGADNRLKIITAYEIDNDSPEADDMVQGKLVDGLKNISSGSAKVISSQKIGPTIANDIKVSAIWAVVLSLIVIFVYIWVRFRKWQFSLGAVTALTHDVLIVLSAFSLFYGILPFSLEIDQAFIAAILTVVGYSINDTVVVFDRIREYDAEHIVRKKPLAEVVNDAVNSTLSRTIMTSFTTFIVLLVLFIAGGETIKGFSFALLIGIVVGTYSSIFVASPVVLEFYKNKDAAVNKA